MILSNQLNSNRYLNNRYFKAYTELIPKVFCFRRDFVFKLKLCHELYLLTFLDFKLLLRLTPFDVQILNEADINFV